MRPGYPTAGQIERQGYGAMATYLIFVLLCLGVKCAGQQQVAHVVRLAAVRQQQLQLVGPVDRQSVLLLTNHSTAHKVTDQSQNHTEID